MKRIARMTSKAGRLLPEGWSRIYTVRGGEKGRGRAIATHEGSGNVGRDLACDLAAQLARDLGYTVLAE